ncbi:hypothetical protein [Paenibacillus sp. A14]|uniref:hypothetical protein n=1 Tax=Paenibacillus sp. A14 TaxID=3119820 RepID=UPI002FE1B4E9
MAIKMCPHMILFQAIIFLIPARALILQHQHSQVGIMNDPEFSFNRALKNSDGY